MRVTGFFILGFAGWIALWFGLRTPLTAMIYTLHPPLVNTMHSTIQRHLLPELWHFVVHPVLLAPSWVLFAVVGAMLLAADTLRGRRVGA